MLTLQSMSFRGVLAACALLTAGIADAGMVTSAPHPMARAVPGVDFDNVIVGTDLQATVAVTVNGLPAYLVRPPTATEIVIRLPDDLPLPDPAYAETYEICRFETAGESTPTECKTAGISGDQPTAPAPPRVDVMAQPERLRGLSLCGDVLYARGDDRLYVYDVSDGAAPSILSVMEVDGLGAFTHQGTLISAIRNGEELLLIDAADPTKLTVRAVVDLGIQASSLGANDRVVVALDRQEGLAIVDVTAWSGPAVVSRVSRAELLEFEHDFIGGVEVDGDLAYVETWNSIFTNGSTVVDVARASHPLVFQHRGMPFIVDFEGDHIYSSWFQDHTSGGDTDFGSYYSHPAAELAIIGTRGGFGAPLVGFVRTSRTGNASWFQVYGNYLYSIDGEIIDVQDPTSPLYGSVVDMRNATPVANGGYLYYFHWYDPQLEIFDVSDLPNIDVTPKPCGATPLHVELTEFTAAAVPRGVQLRWTTASEIDNAGFRILRGLAKSESQVISPLIPASGSALVGASYEYVDAFRGSPGKVWYFLEDIDLNGRVQRHGPITLPRGRQLRVAGQE